MGFYDDKETADQYIEMAKGYDGRELIDVLQSLLSPDSRVLELGMGPGVDFAMLSEKFRATGSDNSAYFLDRYRKIDPDADLIKLDAVTLDTERQFDCIYSNKVLHHLEPDDLAASFAQQRKLLPAGGLIMHSFWRGSDVEEHAGMLFVQQTEESIRALLGDNFDVVEVVVYKEMEDDDSLYVTAKAK